MGVGLALGFACLPAVAAAQEPAPAADAVRAAGAFVDGRAATTALAVIDSRGRAHGRRAGRVFAAASTVKPLLLVAYLRSLRGRGPSHAERRLLGPMIRRSGNRSAGAIYARLGDAPLRRLARRAGLRRFSVAGSWARARMSALDAARFMMRFSRLTPARSRAYARRLLSSVIRRQTWGATRAASAAGWRSFFKSGWRGPRGARLVHGMALFERDGRRFSLAVFSEDNPTFAYGGASLRGVTERLFR